jgi:hypothetical protein
MNGLFFGGHDRGFLKEGVKINLMSLISLLNSPTFFSLCISSLWIRSTREHQGRFLNAFVSCLKRGPWSEQNSAFAEIMATKRIGIPDSALLRPRGIGWEIRGGMRNPFAMNLTREVDLRKIAAVMPDVSGSEVKVQYTIFLHES